MKYPNGRHRLNLTQKELERLSEILTSPEDKTLQTRIQLILVKIEFKDKKPEYLAEPKGKKPLSTSSSEIEKRIEQGIASPWEEYDYLCSIGAKDWTPKPTEPRPASLSTQQQEKLL